MSLPEIELYAIRHAESSKNVARHLISGRNTESPLTIKGIEQSRRLGTILLKENILPDRVYSSTATRAQQTAEHTLRAMGVELEPILDDAIHEMSMGSWESKPRVDLYTPEALDDITRLGKDWKVQGGESMNDVGWRMMNWLDERFGDYEPQAEPMRIFVFTHSLSIRCLASHIYGWGQRKTYETIVPNASVTLVTRQDGDWQVGHIGQYAADDLAGA